VKREDPLGRQPPEYTRNVKVERPSTRKGAQPKTVTDGGRDPSPAGTHRDPYLPPLSAVSGYDPRLQAAIRVFAAHDRRAQAQKKRGRRP